MKPTESNSMLAPRNDNLRVKEAWRRQNLPSELNTSTSQREFLSSLLAERLWGKTSKHVPWPHG